MDCACIKLFSTFTAPQSALNNSSLTLHTSRQLMPCKTLPGPLGAIQGSVPSPWTLQHVDIYGAGLKPLILQSLDD